MTRLNKRHDKLLQLICRTAAELAEQRAADSTLERQCEAAARQWRQATESILAECRSLERLTPGTEPVPRAGSAAAAAASAASAAGELDASLNERC